LHTPPGPSPVDFRDHSRLDPSRRTHAPSHSFAVRAALYSLCANLVQCCMESAGGAFDSAAHADRPLYNIHAVAKRCDMSPITLRSWERRYGIPHPARDSRGNRLYSDRDVAVIRWLAERLDEGVSIGRAVDLMRHLLQATPPLELLEEDTSLQCARSHLLEAIERMDEASVYRVIGERLRVFSLEDVSLHLLQPVLQTVGELWAQGKLSVTTERFGSNIIRAQLTQMMQITPPAARQATILVGCAPGELHDVGPLMLALFLRRRGFRVIFAGANLEPTSLIADVCRILPAAVCLSSSRVETVTRLASIYDALQPEYDGILAFGGRIFDEHPHLIASVPGLYLGTDAASAVTALEKVLIDRSIGRMYGEQ
jgi:DNA-binding transcriptional MerR regulator/methylmalonyl-CoA mutase cobalamin-binding subunit